MRESFTQIEKMVRQNSSWKLYVTDCRTTYHYSSVITQRTSKINSYQSLCLKDYILTSALVLFLNVHKKEKQERERDREWQDSKYPVDLQLEPETTTFSNSSSLFCNLDNGSKL